jgi:hypothetical protein
MLHILIGIESYHIFLEGIVYCLHLSEGLWA